MRNLVIGILTLCALAAHAQGFGMCWLACPDADSASAVWFRHTYLCNSRPLQGTVAVTTVGRFQLYVNESNVTPDFTVAGDSMPVTVTVNITNYLCNDSNTIAILYAPVNRCDPRKQIAVCYYGRERNGRPFAHVADDRWLCRQSGISIKRDGEHIYYNMYGDGGYTRNISLLCWRHAVTDSSMPRYWDCSYRHAGHRMKPTCILKPRYFDLTNDGVEYEFGVGFYGFVRLTLRGTRRGECIMINDNKYICSGLTDEQLYARFVPSYYRRVSVRGGDGFDVSQIQNVEGINLAVVPQSNPYNP